MNRPPVARCERDNLVAGLMPILRRVRRARSHGSRGRVPMRGRILDEVGVPSVRVGDTIASDGIVVKVAERITWSWSPDVVAVRGEVLNLDEIRASDPWLAQWVEGWSRRDGHQVTTWTVQGNHRHRVARIEVPA